MAAGFGDMQSLLKQAQDMQRRMQEMQQALAAQVLEGTAGGGAVTVCITGDQELKSIKIDKAAVDPGDVEALEDLVTVAVRQALAAAKQLREEQTAKVTGGMNLPGMGF